MLNLKEMIEIETERLILREFEKSDWKAVHLYSKLENVFKYETYGPNTETQTKAFIENVIIERSENPRRSFVLCITLKKSLNVIGECEFRINKKNVKRGDLGFIINPDYWGNGFATEASKKIIDFMIENYSISEIEANCDVLNLASKKVLKKCGLKLKREAKDDIELKGRIRNSYYFERIIKEPNNG